MKKLDYLIILFVILFIGIIYLFIYKPYYNNTNENKILIIFDNQIIDEINISEERTYILKTNNENNIDIYIDDVLTKTIPSNNKNIYNEIVIKDNKVIMKDSNCKGKDCMYMETNKISKLPIICTNGVVIKFSTNNKYTSDIII